MKTGRKFTHIILMSALILVGVAACTEEQGMGSGGGQAKTGIQPELSNEGKAIAVVQSIQSGDTMAMSKYINPNKYIQHNLSFPDGSAALIEATESGVFKGTLVNTRRTISDGDFVVLQSLYSGAWNGLKPQVIIDVFRFEKGLIVEHWDNVMALESKPNPSGNTQLDGTTEKNELDKTVSNKLVAKGYIHTVLVKGDIAKIHDFVEGDNYIQHHPDIANGVSGLEAALGQFAKQGIVMEYDKIHYVHGQGNFVLVMSEGKFAGKPYAFFDFLGLQNDKVNQHWGIMAPILPKLEWKNDNGKF